MQADVGEHHFRDIDMGIAFAYQSWQDEPNARFEPSC